MKRERIEARQGWAIPTATDIAFSLAICALLRNYIPPSLKVFLTALAIMDDLGAITIIAFFYTHHLYIVNVFLAFFCAGILFVFNWLGLARYVLYFGVGLFLWLFILRSGIHSTIAGVVLGFFIPLKSHKVSYSPLEKLEHFLQPWVAYGVLPLFAFANTGFSFSTITLSDWFHPVTVGIFMGLFVGKQVGIFLACKMAVKTKMATLPNALKWHHLYAVSVICGIGFTMSLFIGNLSFSNYSAKYMDLVKLGVLSGSIFSGVVGSLLLKRNGHGN